MTVSQTAAPPWLYWLERYTTDQAIQEAATQRVMPLEGLACLSSDIACAELDIAWRQVFIPGPQHVRLLKSWMHRAQRHAQSHYPTLDAFKRLFDQDDEDEDRLENPYPIHCLTGLAGVSKSSLTEAFLRMCHLDGNRRYETAVESFALQPARRMTISSLINPRDLLSELANPLLLAGKKRPSPYWLTKHVRECLRARTTSMLIQDEMQFLTPSSGASTRIAQLIMTLGRLDIPFLYVANYMLIRKLITRPHEERDRLLSHVSVLEPPTADSVWWQSVLASYVDISPESFAINPEISADELHLYTRGIFRVLRDLLVQSYALAREDGANVVTMQTIRRAYKGQPFASHRRDVEDLASISASGWKSDTRLDLVCPLVDDIARAPARRITTSGQIASPPLGIAASMLESTLSQESKKLLGDIRKQASTLAQDEKPIEPVASKVTKLPRPKISTEEALMAGAKRFQEEMKKSRKQRLSKLSIVSSQD